MFMLEISRKGEEYALPELFVHQSAFAIDVIQRGKDNELVCMVSIFSNT